MTVQVNTYKAISSLKLVRAEHITNTDTRASRAKVSNRGNFIIGVHDFLTSRAFHYEGVAGVSVNRAMISSTSLQIQRQMSDTVQFHSWP